MKKFSLLFVLSVIFLSVGCADKGNYIIKKSSGGKIEDIWKLENVDITSFRKTARWEFKDQSGNVIEISGDVNVIKVNDKKIWDAYHEYHAEFNNVSYQELYAQP